jgi:hypothetical protein
LRADVRVEVVPENGSEQQKTSNSTHNDVKQKSINLVESLLSDSTIRQKNLNCFPYNSIPGNHCHRD